MELEPVPLDEPALDSNGDGDGAMPAPESPGKGPAILVAFVALSIVAMLLIGVLPRLVQNKALAESVREEKTTKPEVILTKPHWVPEPAISLPGNIQAIKDTSIYARTTGYINKLFVDIGSRVRAGEVLAVLESPDTDQQVYQAVAQTAQAQATVGQSRAQVAQQQATVAQNVADVSRQRASLQQARAQLDGAVAALAQAQAQERSAEAQLAHTEQTVFQARATLAQAQAGVDLAQLSYNRYATLLKSGYGDLQDVDTAEETLKTDQAQVKSAQAGVTSAEADVRASQQAVAAANAAVHTAETNVESARQNVKANADLLTATQATVKSAQASVAASVETVHANQAAVVSNVHNTQRLDLFRKFEKIVAPFTGVITARNVDVGTLITAGASPNAASGTTADASVISSTPQTGLFGIARTDIVRIQVNVPQTYVPALKQGSTGSVVVREFPGRVFTGNVALRSGALDVVSRTQLIEVHIPNPTGELVPGMYAEVKLEAMHPPMMLHVAGTAVVVDANGTRVATVAPDNTIHFVKVVIGRDLGREVEIMQGLTGNERLVNNPSDTLREGVKVQVVKPTGGGEHRRGGSSA
jgi:multidrug efflux pump subunit AcrA (membrane-fusion protein)